MPLEEKRSATAAPVQCFVTTYLSEVLAARQHDSPQAVAALETLCCSYWYPLYAFVRRRRFGPEDAQDLTQEFFAQLLRKNYPARANPAKGRFRTFLLHALNQFLVDQRERASTLKRGRGQVFFSIDEEQPEGRYRLELSDELTPEKLFERRWARSVLDQALDRLQSEFVAGGKEMDYEVLRSFEPGEQGALTYAEAAGVSDPV